MPIRKNAQCATQINLLGQLGHAKFVKKLLAVKIRKSKQHAFPVANLGVPLKLHQLAFLNSKRFLTGLVMKVENDFAIMFF